MKKLLAVIDYQQDFVAGSLGFPEGKKLEKGIQDAVEQTIASKGFVLFTRDTHTQDYLNTPEGRHLPITHCIAGTEGHRLYGSLAQFEKGSNSRVAVVDKPAFAYPEIGDAVLKLCGFAPEIIEVCGLVTDICVIANAILLQGCFPMADVYVLSSLCGSNNKENAKKALDIMENMGMHIIG